MSKANAASLVSHIVDTLAGTESVVSVELQTEGEYVNVWIGGHLSATLRSTP